jgi:hypothetical protein
LIDQGVERNELPGHDKDHGCDREIRLTEPILGQEIEMQAGAQPEVGVEQRFVGDRDRGRAEQQRNEEEDRQETAVTLPAGEEDA